MIPLKTWLIRPAALLLAGALLAPAAATADVVLQWNGVAASTSNVLGPFAQARFMAITQLAVFEAVNAVTREYDPYLGTLSAPPGASAEAAAVAAAHRVLTMTFPHLASSFDAMRDGSLAAIPDGQAKADGIATGIAAADAMIALRAGDGAANVAFYLPQSSAPGQWLPTSTCTVGLIAHWGNVTPFAIPTAEMFRAAPPPAVSSLAYARDLEEVQRVGALTSADRPQDRADVARFYGMTTGAALWNSAARQVAAAQNRTLSENGRALALLNMAISDALVASVETKYHYTFWRPETAIRNADLDGNDRTVGDPGFLPFVTTPCFPSYPSAHASAGYAASEVLSRIYETSGHSITLTNPIVAGVTLTYKSFKKITDDIDDARVYGGIHFRFDQEAGGKQGRAVGAFVHWRWLRPAGADE